VFSIHCVLCRAIQLLSAGRGKQYRMCSLYTVFSVERIQLLSAGRGKHTHTHSRTHTHTHALSYFFSLSLSHVIAQKPSPRTHAHTRTHTLSLSHTHTHRSRRRRRRWRRRRARRTSAQKSAHIRSLLPYSRSLLTLLVYAGEQSLEEARRQEQGDPKSQRSQKTKISQSPL
jgi:hypothetical protein